MRELLKDIFYWLIKATSPLFYPEAKLEGKYFQERSVGWIWVFRGIWFQKILGFNRDLPFPTIPGVRISDSKNLVLGKNNLNNFQSPGVYFQNFSAKIILGDEVYIGPNVGIITANHDFNDLDVHLPGKDVHIGSNSWIGMNSVIMPGVTLGPSTIVGAGSIVTKSFIAGNMVIAGNPAKTIRLL